MHRDLQTLKCFKKAENINRGIQFHLSNGEKYHLIDRVMHGDSQRSIEIRFL